MHAAVAFHPHSRISLFSLQEGSAHRESSERVGGVALAFFDVADDVVTVCEELAMPFLQGSERSASRAFQVLGGWVDVCSLLGSAELFADGLDGMRERVRSAWCSEDGWGVAAVTSQLVKEVLMAGDALLSLALRVGMVAHDFFASSPELLALTAWGEGASIGLYLVLYVVKLISSGVVLYEVHTLKQALRTLPSDGSLAPFFEAHPELHAKLKRHVSGNGVEASVDALVAELKQEERSTLLYLALRTASLVLFGLSFIFTAGLPAALLWACGMAINGIWLSIDLPEFLKAVREKDFGKWDQMLLKVAATVLVGALLVASLLASSVEVSVALLLSGLLLSYLLWTALKPLLEMGNSCQPTQALDY